MAERRKKTERRKKKVVVVVPAFDEAARIAETVTALKRLARPMGAAGCTLRVLVIDDGSADSTGEEATKAGAHRVIRHKVNLGLGAAVRTGLAAAREDGADIAVKFDADLQHDPKDVRAVIAPILADKADVVYGDRFERLEYRMPMIRRIGNAVFTRLMRWLTGWPVRDGQPGIFAVDAAYLRVFSLPGDYNYTQQLLIDAYHKGMRFAQAPVAFRARETGKSFVTLKYPFRVLAQILMVLVSLKPLRVFVPVGVFFLGVAVVVFSVQITDWLLGGAQKPVENVNLVLGCGLFGLQTLLFGLLAELIVRRGK